MDCEFLDINVVIKTDWKEYLAQEMDEKYYHNIDKKLIGKDEFYPPSELIFNVFNICPLKNIKVVILGQDPYINKGEAMGLSFSVNKFIQIPPSLRNIYKELHDDIGCDIPQNGDLTKWVEKGVFLLNAVLTVDPKTPNSHSNFGWCIFTDKVIKIISDNLEHVVFILWGNSAKRKSILIDLNKHLILKGSHPSPMSANRGGFFGEKYFSKTNEYLVKNSIEPIDWSLE